MKHEDLEVKLKGVLKKLEFSAEKIVQTRGYTREVEKIKVLSELIKEQLKNENSCYSNRQTW